MIILQVPLKITSPIERVKYFKGHTKDIDKILRKHVLKIKTIFHFLVNFQNLPKLFADE